MMRYLALIYDNEKKLASLPEGERGERHKAWYAYSGDLAQAGKMLAGDALQSTESATTVRVQNGKSVISDGPFAETKEQLGGYFLIDAKDLDEAINWASRMPHLAGGGSVEVRPIWEIPDMPRPSA